MADFPDQANEKLMEDCVMEVDNENNEAQVDDKEAGTVQTSQALGEDTEVWVVFNPFNLRFPPEEMMHRFNDWLHRYPPSQISK